MFKKLMLIALVTTSVGNLNANPEEAAVKVAVETASSVLTAIVAPQSMISNLGWAAYAALIAAAKLAAAAIAGE